MRTTQLKIHPLADIFPALSSKEFAELKESIQANGLLNRIVVIEEGDDTLILDGRHRYQALSELGVEVNPSLHLTTYRSDKISLEQFVIASNVNRRHLKTSQRALIAAGLANLKDGEQKRHAGGKPTASLQEAADILNVNRATVAEAKRVLNSGNAELIEKVRQGKQTVGGAIREINGETGEDRTKEATFKKRHFFPSESSFVNGRIIADLVSCLNPTDHTIFAGIEAIKQSIADIESRISDELKSKWIYQSPTKIK